MNNPIRLETGAEAVPGDRLVRVLGQGGAVRQRPRLEEIDGPRRLLKIVEQLVARDAHFP
jgi:hypothetical protein